jgi:hypothetical protein
VLSVRTTVPPRRPRSGRSAATPALKDWTQTLARPAERVLPGHKGPARGPHTNAGPSVRHYQPHQPRPAQRATVTVLLSGRTSISARGGDTIRDLRIGENVRATGVLNWRTRTLSLTTSVVVYYPNLSA